MQDSQIPVIVIAGPTAVGKTALSIDLAKAFNGLVINGDSLQVYRHLDIGTGKITPEEMEGIPHRLFDCLDVTETYDASRFQEAASDLIRQAHAQGYLPIIVGGTGLYLESLLYDRSLGGKDSHDPEVRAYFQSVADQVGPKALWALLRQRDPEAAAKIPYQNVRRTIRALEVLEVTGEKFSQQEPDWEPRFDSLVLVLDRPRQELYDRINRRVEGMVDVGLESEVSWLYDQVQGREVQSTKGIGYKEWWPYLQGEASLDQVVESIQQNSRRYAKRQLTWFRNRLPDRVWLTIPDQDESLVLDQAKSLVADFLDERSQDK